MDERWNKIKKDYWAGTLVFAFFVVFSFFMAPSYRLSELTKKTVKLSGNPVWKEKHHKGSDYWVNLYFFGDPKEYEISGIDYKYLDYPAFKDSIKNGELVTIGVMGCDILTLEKRGTQYMNFDKAQSHKVKNRIWARGLFLTGLICCIFPLCFSTHPTLTIGRQEIRIRFDLILFVSLAIAFIILLERVHIFPATNRV
ncbi:MAG: hypothetical protein SFV22_13950 [Saprospiraceae bacterium]|nr:hypothetical protein [Saprospiraceae bacterium]